MTGESGKKRCTGETGKSSLISKPGQHEGQLLRFLPYFLLSQPFPGGLFNVWGKKAFQSWRATPLLDLRNWDRGTKMGRFSEFRGWKLWREKTQSSSRHARVLLWSMNLSFSLTGSLSRLPQRCTCEKYIYCHMSQSEAVLVAQISLHWCSYNLRYVTKIISWLIVIA